MCYPCWVRTVSAVVGNQAPRSGYCYRVRGSFPGSSALLSMISEQAVNLVLQTGHKVELELRQTVKVSIQSSYSVETRISTQYRFTGILYFRTADITIPRLPDSLMPSTNRTLRRICFTLCPWTTAALLTAPMYIGYLTIIQCYKLVFHCEIYCIQYVDSQLFSAPWLVYKALLS